MQKYKGFVNPANKKSKYTGDKKVKKIAKK